MGLEHVARLPDAFRSLAQTIVDAHRNAPQERRSGAPYTRRACSGPDEQIGCCGSFSDRCGVGGHNNHVAGARCQRAVTCEKPAWSPCVTCDITANVFIRRACLFERWQDATTRIWAVRALFCLRRLRVPHHRAGQRM